MPETRFSEAALARRRERHEYVATFPGLIGSWGEAVGKSVEVVVGGAAAQVVVFTDGSFLVAGSGPPDGEALLAALDTGRTVLAHHQREGYAELDRRLAAEREAMRLARMEKVIGAVETNLPQIPELRERLKRLLPD